MAIKIYITKTLGAGIGDKGVLGNQMKTVFSSVMVPTKLSQVLIDMLFGYMVSTTDCIGPELMVRQYTTETYVKKVADKYFATKSKLMLLLNNRMVLCVSLTNTFIIHGLQ